MLEIVPKGFSLVVGVADAPGHQAGFFVGQVVAMPGFFDVKTGFIVENVGNSRYGGWVGNGGMV